MKSNPPKNDYFKIDPRNTTTEDYNYLIDLLKHHSKRINVFEVDMWIYFSIEDISYFGDYLNKISTFAYYHHMENIYSEDEFNKIVSDFDLRNDLLEG